MIHFDMQKRAHVSFGDREMDFITTDRLHQISLDFPSELVTKLDWKGLRSTAGMYEAKNWMSVACHENRQDF